MAYPLKYRGTVCRTCGGRGKNNNNGRGRTVRNTVCPLCDGTATADILLKSILKAKKRPPDFAYALLKKMSNIIQTSVPYIAEQRNRGLSNDSRRESSFGLAGQSVLEEARRKQSDDTEKEYFKSISRTAMRKRASQCPPAVALDGDKVMRIHGTSKSDVTAAFYQGPETVYSIMKSSSDFIQIRSPDPGYPASSSDKLPVIGAAASKGGGVSNRKAALKTKNLGFGKMNALAAVNDGEIASKNRRKSSTSSNVAIFQQLRQQLRHRGRKGSILLAEDGLNAVVVNDPSGSFRLPTIENTQKRHSGDSKWQRGGVDSANSEVISLPPIVDETCTDTDAERIPRKVSFAMGMFVSGRPTLELNNRKPVINSFEARKSYHKQIKNSMVRSRAKMALHRWRDKRTLGKETFYSSGSDYYSSDDENSRLSRSLKKQKMRRYASTDVLLGESDQFDDRSSSSDFETTIKDDRLVERRTKNRTRKKRLKQLEHYLSAISDPDCSDTEEQLAIANLSQEELESIKTRIQRKRERRRLTARRNFRRIVIAVVAVNAFLKSVRRDDDVEDSAKSHLPKKKQERYRRLNAKKQKRKKVRWNPNLREYSSNSQMTSYSDFERESNKPENIKARFLREFGWMMEKLDVDLSSITENQEPREAHDTNDLTSTEVEVGSTRPTEPDERGFTDNSQIETYPLQNTNSRSIAHSKTTFSIPGGKYDFNKIGKSPDLQNETADVIPTRYKDVSAMQTTIARQAIVDENGVMVDGNIDGWDSELTADKPRMRKLSDISFPSVGLQRERRNSVPNEDKPDYFVYFEKVEVKRTKTKKKRQRKKSKTKPDSGNNSPCRSGKESLGSSGKLSITSSVTSLMDSDGAPPQKARLQSAGDGPRVTLKEVRIPTSNLRRTGSTGNLNNEDDDEIDLRDLTKGLQFAAKDVKIQIVERKRRRQRKKEEQRLKELMEFERDLQERETRMQEELLAAMLEAAADEPPPDEAWKIHLRPKDCPHIPCGVAWNQKTVAAPPEITEDEVYSDLQYVSRLFLEMMECKYIRWSKRHMVVINKLRQIEESGVLQFV